MNTPDNIYFNVGLIINLIAVGFAFFSPKIAFFILLTRPMMMGFDLRFKLRNRLTR